MKNITLVIHTNKYWSDFVIIDYDGKGEILKINKFYKITDERLIIYDTKGGHDNLEEGDVLHDINLRNSNFRQIQITT